MKCEYFCVFFWLNKGATSPTKEKLQNNRARLRDTRNYKISDNDNRLQIMFSNDFCSFSQNQNEKTVSYIFREKCQKKCDGWVFTRSFADTIREQFTQAETSMKFHA